VEVDEMIVYFCSDGVAIGGIGEAVLWRVDLVDARK
jgi:hypothetical protein